MKQSGLYQPLSRGSNREGSGGSLEAYSRKQIIAHAMNLEERINTLNNIIQAQEERISNLKAIIHLLDPGPPLPGGKRPVMKVMRNPDNMTSNKALQ